MIVIMPDASFRLVQNSAMYGNGLFRTPCQRDKAEERLAKAKACFELRWAAFDLFTDGHTELEVGLKLGFGPDPIKARQKASDLKKAIAKMLAPLKPEGTSHEYE